MLLHIPNVLDLVQFDQHAVRGALVAHCCILAGVCALDWCCREEAVAAMGKFHLLCEQALHHDVVVVTVDDCVRAVAAVAPSAICTVAESRQAVFE